MSSIEFEDQYFKVFDKKTDEILLCGRDECKKLISICNAIRPDVSFGDLDSGRMDVDAVKNLAREKGIID